MIESIRGIEGLSVLTRVKEVQQRIDAIEKQVGLKDFQATLEAEIAKQEKVSKPQTLTNPMPLEQFLAKVRADEEAANLIKTARENAAKAAAQNKTVEVFDFATQPASSSIPIYDVYEAEYFGGDEEYFDEPIDDYYEDDFAYAPTTDEMIETAARKYGVDADLVRAIGTAESNLNQDAISHVGAIGVMQLMPETAASLGVNPYDEQQNIEGGAHYIRQMLDHFNGNLHKAIAAYNAGPGAVQQYGGIPPYSETQEYVGRVMDFYVR